MTEISSKYQPSDCKIANHYYEAIKIKISNHDCYTFIIKSSINIVAYIYQHNFNIYKPHLNLLVHYNGSQNETQLNFEVYLQTTIKYVLVVTTYLPNIIGNFSIVVSNPSQVNFNRSMRK